MDNLKIVEQLYRADMQSIMDEEYPGFPGGEADDIRIQKYNALVEQWSKDNWDILNG